LGHFDIKAEIATEKELKSMGILQNRTLNRVTYLLEQRLGIKLNKNIVTEQSQVYDTRVLNSPKNTYLQGYWQSPSYFQKINSQIRKDFVFTKSMNSTNVKISKLIKNSNSVSVHIRRGDYLTDASVKKTFPSMSEGYYKSGMKIIEKQIKTPTYFVFSDDMDWARSNILSSHKIYFVSHNRGKLAYEDMRLISLCKHNIISNSTFSWWGAFLSINKNKIIIAPRKWSGTELGRDLVLKDWIKI